MSSPLTPTRPTAFAELNGVLADLVANASRILGDNLVGAYLQGSFAVGDGDRYSDCDFLIAVQAPLTAKQEAGLRALHDHLPTWKVTGLVTSRAPTPCWPTFAPLTAWAGSGSTSTTAGVRCSGRRTATPKSPAGRCASAASC